MSVCPAGWGGELSRGPFGMNEVRSGRVGSKKEGCSWQQGAAGCSTLLCRGRLHGCPLSVWRLGAGLPRGLVSLTASLGPHSTVAGRAVSHRPGVRRGDKSVEACPWRMSGASFSSPMRGHVGVGHSSGTPRMSVSPLVARGLSLITSAHQNLDGLHPSCHLLGTCRPLFSKCGPWADGIIWDLLKMQIPALPCQTRNFGVGVGWNGQQSVLTNPSGILMHEKFREPLL